MKTHTKKYWPAFWILVALGVALIAPVSTWAGAIGVIAISAILGFLLIRYASERGIFAVYAAFVLLLGYAIYSEIRGRILVMSEEAVVGCTETVPPGTFASDQKTLEYCSCMTDKMINLMVWQLYKEAYFFSDPANSRDERKPVIDRNMSICLPPDE